MTPARLERLCDGRDPDDEIVVTVAQARVLLSRLAGTAQLVERPFTPPAPRAHADDVIAGHWELGVDLAAVAGRPATHEHVLTPPPTDTFLPVPAAAKVRRWCGPWKPGWTEPAAKENP